MKLRFTLFFAMLASSFLFAQKKINYELNSGFITDSTSTIFFSVGVEKSFGKMGYSEGLSNILVYNFVTEQSQKLFPNDSLYISFYRRNYREYQEERQGRELFFENFYIFNTSSRKKGGFTDCSNRAKVMYICDKQGKNLKRINPENENCVSVDFFEKQGFILFKIQKDSNNDECFSEKDDDFYFKRLNIKDLSFGKDIVLKK
jgi:hypothetical protein